MIEVNDILKEVQSEVSSMKLSENRSKKIQARLRRVQSELERESQTYMRHYDRCKRLVKAADAISDDWREFPWVKEEGFVKDLPVESPAYDASM